MIIFNIMNLKEKEEKITIISTIIKFNKQGLISVLFLVIYPIIIYTILIITYGILFYYFNSPCLCDGESLNELNGKLTTFIIEYNKLYSEYTHYDNLLSQATYRPERNDFIMEYLSNKKIEAFMKMSHKLSNIRCIESNIKGINPDFTSTIKKELYEYF